MYITVLLFSLKFQVHQETKIPELFFVTSHKTWLISVAQSGAPGAHVTMYTHTLIHSATFRLN